DSPLRLEPLEPVNQLLDAPDGERRDNQLPAALCRLGDNLREPRARVILLMDAIAVCRLDEQDIRFVHHDRIREHRTPEASEIATEKNRAAVDAHPYEGGSQQVTRVDEFDLDAGGNRHRPLVPAGLQL